jgi:hypothetical protein
MNVARSVGVTGLAFAAVGGYVAPMLSRFPSPSWHPTGFIEPCLPTPSPTVADGPLGQFLW